MLPKQLKLLFLPLLISCMVFVHPASALTTLPQYTALAATGVGVLGAIVASALSSSDSNKQPSNNDTDQATITVNSIHFDTPAVAKELVLTNTAASAATINNITIDDSVHGVTIQENSCQSVPANGSCTIKLIATTEAYGQGQINIAYGNGHQTTGGVSVASTSLQLCEELKNGDCTTISPSTEVTIKKDENTPSRTFKYKNIGNFAWQTPAIAWKINFDNNENDQVVKLVTDLAPALVLPNDTYSFTLTTKQDEPGNWGTLEATGLNLNTSYLKNILCTGGIEVINNLDPADQHLGYHSVKIVSTVESGSAEITEFNTPTISSNLAGKVKYCSQNDSDCSYISDPNCMAGRSLAKGESCKVWFKSVNNDSNDLYKINDGTITIALKAEWVGKTQSFPETEVFSVVVDKALYVGGNNVFAKWDGTNWSPLFSGLTQINASIINTDESDLYIGGSFSQFNNVAKWNGATLLPLGNGTNGTVNALTIWNNWNNALFVAGSFTTPGTNVASWESSTSTWSQMGTGIEYGIVNALLFNSKAAYDNICAGGAFSAQGDNIARWDTFTWRPIWDDFGDNYVSGGGTNGPVNALAAVDTILYVGGSFTSVGYKDDSNHYRVSANNIAKVELQGGVRVWAPVNSGVTGQVNAFAVWGNSLYIGGEKFSNLGSNLAKWDGSSLTAIGQWCFQSNDSVNALAVTGNSLYVGGAFSENSAVNISANITKWDDSSLSWSPIAAGVNVGQVNTLTIANSIASFEWAKTVLPTT